ncbi:DNA mismatch repair endonuclease MutL [Salinibacillus xinjiangensis]|uniref:DNA mismatch repair protein MutL n=1 Tax=Salinibacillus xinjiangensis TaxID=1229268 RepID=A0A6G1X3B7_9BACI|nr:DNA mismatch repair endonuclease MutL [Salinibacillus xinjiangensis]MRG85318.1 DNA mismatch repair endonuclease MutL [Salinibacillus xinjiangensis]
MGNIRLMPDHLANKIAAGEVVERPSSVIKELVENSIDANSSWVKVELEEAGLSTIKIADDGDGMTEDDCERAFFRHATSKISSEGDLFRVHTLGFRGEALASIAAVSRLTMRTSTGEQAGNHLILEGGKLISNERSDARKGTEIVVKDLFFNTPARLKYMKTIHTELGHITDVLNRMALSYPKIRFECIHNGKRLFYTSGRGDQRQVISQIYGMQTAKKMLPIQHETLDFEITGFIARPEITRANRQYMSTIVNGRYIRNHMLNKAILRGYHTLLPIGRYPLVVLNIEMDPYLVDVNVHPAKLEVRFSKEKELFEAIERAVKNVFKQQTLIPEIKQDKPKKEKSEQGSFSLQYNHQESDNQVNQIPWEKLMGSHSESQSIFNPEPIKDPTPSYPEPTFSEPDFEDSDEEIEAETIESVKEEKDRVPVLYPVGQAHGTYIIAQNDQGLYLIDQHAAQERIKYEFYREKVGAVPEELQQLLVPLTFEFSKQESIFIQAHQEDLKTVGLFFEPFGEHTYIIRSHPQWFPKGEEEEIIRDMVDQVLENQKVDIKKLREDAAILMSCKRSIKANHHLNYDDMFRLLEDLRQCQDPFTCPHGRPIIIFFSEYELEKMFKRVM